MSFHQSIYPPCMLCQTQKSKPSPKNKQKNIKAWYWNQQILDDEARISYLIVRVGEPNFMNRKLKSIEDKKLETWTMPRSMSKVPEKVQAERSTFRWRSYLFGMANFGNLVCPLNCSMLCFWSIFFFSDSLSLSVMWWSLGELS